jgi:hypothetical protein
MLVIFASRFSGELRIRWHRFCFLKDLRAARSPPAALFAVASFTTTWRPWLVSYFRKIRACGEIVRHARTGRSLSLLTAK